MIREPISLLLKERVDVLPIDPRDGRRPGGVTEVFYNYC